MSRVTHGPCPKCGSRDNLARWPDGHAWCFGCKYWEPRNDNSLPDLLSMGSAGERSSTSLSSTNELRAYHSSDTSLGSDAVSWLAKYGISGSDALKYGFRYDKSFEQLLLPLYAETGTLVGYQAKNFDPRRAAKAKYFNAGSKEEAFPLYCKKEEDPLSGSVGINSRTSANAGFNSTECVRNGRTIGLTEDILSAIRISSFIDGMPLLGTSLSTNKIVRLHKRGYTKVIVWLDRDKWKEAMDIADKFKWLGLSASTLLTEKDPKEYSDDEIKDYLK